MTTGDRNFLQDDEQFARALLRPQPTEPRAGFAASVALAARDRRAGSFASWLRWSGGGLALAGAAAVALVFAQPGAAPAGRQDELVLAQRLELYEDMTVMQNQEALEDLEVVSVLHTLTQKGQP